MQCSIRDKRVLIGMIRIPDRSDGHISEAVQICFGRPSYLCGRSVLLCHTDPAERKGSFLHTDHNERRVVNFIIVLPVHFVSGHIKIAPVYIELIVRPGCVQISFRYNKIKLCAGNGCGAVPVFRLHKKLSADRDLQRIIFCSEMIIPLRLRRNDPDRQIFCGTDVHGSVITGIDKSYAAIRLKRNAVRRDGSHVHGDVRGPYVDRTSSVNGQIHVSGSSDLREIHFSHQAVVLIVRFCSHVHPYITGCCYGYLIAAFQINRERHCRASNRRCVANGHFDSPQDLSGSLGQRAGCPLPVCGELRHVHVVRQSKPGPSAAVYNDAADRQVFQPDLFGRAVVDGKRSAVPGDDPAIAFQRFVIPDYFLSDIGTAGKTNGIIRIASVDRHGICIFADQLIIVVSENVYGDVGIFTEINIAAGPAPPFRGTVYGI